MKRRRFLHAAAGSGLGLASLEMGLEELAAETVGPSALTRIQPGRNLILTNASLIDAIGPEPLLKATVVIKEGRIMRVGAMPPSRSESQDAQVIDLGGNWLLPGLCDAHSHFISPLQAPPRETVIDRYLRFGKGAIDALQVGVTCARVLGAPDFVDVAWRKAFDRGLFLGPRLFVAGRSIISTGGHGSGYDYGQKVEANGPDEMRRVVREEIQGDVDLIKLVISGGVFGVRSDNLDYNQLLPEEVDAAFRTAQQRGYKVAVHAGNAEGVKMAVRAGAYTIEHGYVLDQEAIQLMVEHRTILVPTLCVTFLNQKAAESPYEKEWARQWPLPENLLERAEARRHVHLQAFKAALEAGVRIASGADQSPIAETALLEIELLVRCGMSPMQAIMAATRLSAEAATAEKEVGTVEVGKLADLLVVGASPLDSIHHLRQTRMVFKEGKLVVDKR